LLIFFFFFWLIKDEEDEEALDSPIEKKENNLVVNDLTDDKYRNRYLFLCKLGCLDFLILNSAKIRPLLTIFDSLGGTGKTAAFNTIKNYIKREYEAVFNEQLDDTFQFETHVSRVPSQMNGCDCGLFLIHYVEQFVKECEDSAFLEKLVYFLFPFFCFWYLTGNKQRHNRSVKQ